MVKKMPSSTERICPLCGLECYHCGQCGRQCAPRGNRGLTLLCSDACVASWQAQEALLGHQWDRHEIPHLGYKSWWVRWTSISFADCWHAAHADPIELFREAITSGRKNGVVWPDPDYPAPWWYRPGCYDEEEPVDPRAVKEICLVCAGPCLGVSTSLRAVCTKECMDAHVAAQVLNGHQVARPPAGPMPICGGVQVRDWARISETEQSVYLI